MENVYKTCVQCNKAIEYKRISRLFCNTVCRMKAFRGRNKALKGLSVTDNALSVTNSRVSVTTKPLSVTQKTVSVTDLPIRIEYEETVINPFTGKRVSKDLLEVDA